MEQLSFRDATEADLPAIVAMLADDFRGSTREDASLPLDRGYFDAFAAIETSPNQRLIVAVEGGQIVGTLQLLFVPAISRKGSWRGQIEGVRIARERREQGLGEAMVRWAVGECRARGCALVQLTSDNSRTDAHRFWERLGFAPSHRGFKMMLTGG